MTDQQPTVPQPPPPASDGGAGLASRTWTKFRGWPIWAQIGTGLVLLFVMIAAVSGGDDDEPVEVAAAETTTTTEAPTFLSALDGASVSFMDDDELLEALEVTCEALEGSSTDRAAKKVHDHLDDVINDMSHDQLVEISDVLADAAPDVCPDAVADHPDFVIALVALTPETTTTTSTTTTTTTTTAPPTTTTAPPPPPTTAAPAPPPPPPPPSASYKNCTEARAAGAAPVYRGDPGYGTHLDRDGDGVGCE